MITTILIFQSVLNFYFLGRSWYNRKLINKTIEANHLLVKETNRVIEEVNEKFQAVSDNFKITKTIFNTMIEKDMEEINNRLDKTTELKINVTMDAEFIPDFVIEPIEELTIDTILDKINNFGMESLTEEENEFLRNIGFK